MAVVSVVADLVEEQIDRFIRDCTKPEQKPLHKMDAARVLRIAGVFKEPQIVLVNGRAFVAADASEKPSADIIQHALDGAGWSA